MARVNKKILATVEQSREAAHGADGLPIAAYNATEDGSELDYLTELLHKARLAPYREELLEELQSWQAGEVPINVPLRHVEELIDEEVLEPDVLVLYDHMYDTFNDE